MNQPFAICSINSHHCLIRWIMICWIISLCTGLVKADLSRLDLQDLKPNTLFECHLSGGQTDNYTIALTAGQGIKIKVEQRGIDVYLMLSGPDGKVLIKENGWEEAYGAELIVWAAKIEGVYQLQIGAAEKQVGAGNYEIKLEVFPTDERFVSAVEKFNVGLQLEKDKQPEQALGSFEQSIKIWQALGDREMTGRALYNAAYFASELSLLSKAMDYSLQALDIFRSLGMQREEYTVLSVVAFSYGAIGDIPKALYYERQRIPLLSVVSPRAAINLHLNLGISSRRIGDHFQAEEYLNEALRRARDLKLQEEELLALSALATLYYVTNEPLRSIESINAALPLSRDLKQPIREGRLLLQLGQIYARAAEPQQAINFFNQAL
jgi:tetratricopeptide (TPR) repeat protein